MTLDVHPEDLGGMGKRLIRIRRKFDATGFASATNLDLSLYDDRLSQCFGRSSGVFRGASDTTLGHRHPDAGK
jgi:hypothetical protein